MRWTDRKRLVTDVNTLFAAVRGHLGSAYLRGALVHGELEVYRQPRGAEKNVLAPIVTLTPDKQYILTPYCPATTHRQSIAWRDAPPALPAAIRDGLEAMGYAPRKERSAAGGDAAELRAVLG